MVDKGQENTQRQSVVERRQVLGETVRELLAFDDEQGLRLILNNQHQVDLAELVVQLGYKDRQQVFAFLAVELAAEVLAELDTATMLDVAEDLGEGNLSGLVGEMQPDDAADLLGDLPEDQSEQVLGQVPAAEAGEIGELLAYPEDTGGGVGAIDHHAQRRICAGDLLRCGAVVIASMGIGVQRFYWFGALLWGCASHPVAEKESWSVGAAALLRAQLDADAAIVAVDAGLLSRFYLQRGDRPAWCGPTGPRAQADALLRILHQATDDGLRSEDYALAQIEDRLGRWRNPGAKPDLASMMRLDVLLTRAFFACGGHLQWGRVDPRAIHPQWQAPRQAADLAGLLQAALDRQQVESALARLRPPQAGYYHLRQALRTYREIAAAGGWPEIGPGGGGPLLQRLVLVGDLAGGVEEWSRAEMIAGIAQFQERHGLDPSGRLDALTLAALNVPVADRLAAIELNMERWRWLPHDPGTRYILVRIADFELDAVEAGETVLNMRVIVGKPYWRTPIFSAQLTHLVFNPFWYIPRSIAVDEILPMLRRDPDYLQRRDMVVTAGEGLELVSVDPDSVDWTSLTADDFSYAFTQVPSPANPLGKIKFLFPNPYNVYLHDTPNTELFAERIRAFSHGCIRLEKSTELAAYALRQEGQWPLARIVREVVSGVNREIALERPMPVYLLYWTTWIDAAGLVQFRQDDYDADLNLGRMLRRE